MHNTIPVNTILLSVLYNSFIVDFVIAENVLIELSTIIFVHVYCTFYFEDFHHCSPVQAQIEHKDAELVRRDTIIQQVRQVRRNLSYTISFDNRTVYDLVDWWASLLITAVC